LVVLVAADAVEAERLGVLELVQILVVDVVALARIVERVRNIDPHRAVLGAEIIRQIGPWHQVEPREFHRRLREPGLESRRWTRALPRDRAVSIVANSGGTQGKPPGAGPRRVATDRPSRARRDRRGDRPRVGAGRRASTRTARRGPTARGVRAGNRSARGRDRARSTLRRGRTRTSAPGKSRSALPAAASTSRPGARRRPTHAARPV